MFFSISFLFTANTSRGQDQKIADSLLRSYRMDTSVGTTKLELLRNLSFNEIGNLDLALQYADELISLSTLTNNYLYQHRGYYQKGNKYRLKGNLEAALDAYFKSSESARKVKFTTGEGAAYSAIADVYSISNNHDNATLYYKKAIATLRSSGDSIALGSAISNAGDEFMKNKRYDSALSLFREAGLIFDKVDYPVGKAYTLGNIGMLYANLGSKKFAEENINAAIRILESSKDYYPICVYLISMSNIYQEKGQRSVAMDYAQRSLQLALQYGLKEQISDANLQVYKLYEGAGNSAEAIKYFKNHISYRDSVNNVRSVQNMADLRTNYELSKKQVEVDLLTQQKRNQQLMMISLGVITVLISIVLGTLYLYSRHITKEKKISESLLLNILPAETAKELKRNGKVEATKFDKVTVLFTDFVEFSKSAEFIEPEQLVRSIDFYFKGFDEITTKYGLEKIKTIGDSYMCACGLPTANPSQARNVVAAAMEMIAQVTTEWKAIDSISHFDVRIGIHTGPVVAGIVGIKKWQYDIWGDTVNIASRMESMSKAGRINISETTHEEIKDEFPCEYRGEIEVKNRGSLKMYFLK